VRISASAGDSATWSTGSFVVTLPLRRKPTLSTTRGRSFMIDPSTRLPSFAIVAYARAMSRGLTATNPKPIEKYAGSLERIPSRCAVSTIDFGPTMFVSCAYTELSECTIAVARSTLPR
jgi:hypothetical protein